MSTVNEILQDQIIHHSAVDLMRVEASERRKVLKMLKDLERDLVSDLATIDPTAPKRTVHQTKRLQALLKQTQDTIKTHMDKVSGAVDADLITLAAAEAAFVSGAMTAALGAKVVSVAMSPSRLKALARNTLVEGAFPSQWWKKQTQAIQDKFAREMRMGMQRAETIGDLSRRIRKNVMPVSRRNAEALARTSVMAVLNESRRESYDQMGDLIKGYKYVATLDGRTTPYCKAADGTVFKKNHKVAKGPRWVSPPPNHWQCFIDPQIPVYTDKGYKPIGKIKVGDMVLTHQGRFRPVTELLRQYKQTPVVYTLNFDVKKNISLTATEEHPVLVKRDGKSHWVPIKDIRVGDSVLLMADRCSCGELKPYWLKYCRRSCGTSHYGGNWAKDPKKRKAASKRASEQLRREYEKGIRDPYAITRKANEKTRQMIQDGVHPFSGENLGDRRFTGADFTEEQRKFISKRMKENNPTFDPEVRKKISDSTKKRLAENPDLHPNRIMAKKGFMSSLEKNAARALDRQGICYEAQFPIGPYFADFAIPSLKIVLEIDGDYWHTDKEREATRDFFLKKEGWDVFHIDEKTAKNQRELYYCINRILNNHEGMFEFMDVEVTANKSWTPKKPKILYNFSVEEDESYVVKGFVVHNCRSVLSPLTKSWAELRAQYKGDKRKRKDLLEPIPPQTRASMDGKVPKDWKYTDWLKNQSDSMQNSILGPKRADLFRAGKITSMVQLLDQHGNFLTVKDLLKAISSGTLADPITGRLL